MKTKILSVVTALAIAMTSFVSLAITASAYTLTCNGNSLDEVISVYPGNTLWSDIALYVWLDGDCLCDGEQACEVPGNYNEYNVDDIYYDEDEPSVTVNLSGLGDPAGAPYTLTCNGNPVNEGDTIYAGAVIQSNIELWVQIDLNGDTYELYSDDEQGCTLPGYYDSYRVDYIDYETFGPSVTVNLEGWGDMNYAPGEEPVDPVDPPGGDPVSYVLTSNGVQIKSGDTLHSGDVIASTIELWIKLKKTWIYTDKDGQHTFTLPGTNAEYTVTEIDTDYLPDEIDLYIQEVPVPVNSVSLSESDISLLKGETQSLSVTVLPDTAYDKSVTWTSSDASVASVDENGLVTAVAAGVATITASSNMTSGKSASCTVTVTTPPSTAEISIDDVDAYIDNQGFGHLRVISKVLFENKDAEYFGAWFIPADLQSDDKYEKAQVLVSAEIESGDTFASDLRNIPAESNERSILVIPFIKLFGEENLATTFRELTVSANKNETSR